MNGTVAKQWLWRNKDDLEIESLLSQSFSFKARKTHITAIFTHLVLKRYKKKNLRCLFKATTETAENGELYL